MRRPWTLGELVVDIAHGISRSVELAESRAMSMWLDHRVHRTLPSAALVELWGTSSFDVVVVVVVVSSSSVIVVVVFCTPSP